MKLFRNAKRFAVVFHKIKSDSSWVLPAAMVAVGGSCCFANEILEKEIKEVDSSLAAQAEHLYANTNIHRQKVLDFLNVAKDQNSDDVGVLWRLARAQYDVAQLNETSKVNSKKLMYEAYEVIQKALKLNEVEDYAVHKWYGIILSAIGDLEGTKVSIANSYVVKEHWEKAVQLNPKDATSHHLLGRWCKSVAEISWVGRQVAATLFGKVPVASIEQALAHFVAAENISPGFWKKNNVMIAECYLGLNEKEQAKTWLQQALNIPVVTEEDEKSHELAKTLLAKL